MDRYNKCQTKQYTRTHTHCTHISRWSVLGWVTTKEDHPLLWFDAQSIEIWSVNKYISYIISYIYCVSTHTIKTSDPIPLANSITIDQHLQDVITIYDYNWSTFTGSDHNLWLRLINTFRMWSQFMRRSMCTHKTNSVDELYCGYNSNNYDMNDKQTYQVSASKWSNTRDEWRTQTRDRQWWFSSTDVLC